MLRPRGPHPARPPPAPHPGGVTARPRAPPRPQRAKRQRLPGRKKCSGWGRHTALGAAVRFTRVRSCSSARSEAESLEAFSCRTRRATLSSTGREGSSTRQASRSPGGLSEVRGCWMGTLRTRAPSAHTLQASLPRLRLHLGVGASPSAGNALPILSLLLWLSRFGPSLLPTLARLPLFVPDSVISRGTPPYRLSSTSPTS